MAGASRQRSRTHLAKHKLPRLSENAEVTKRPLLHHCFPSPHSSVAMQKVLYVSTRTPFIAAVKRIESLLRNADQKLMQSMATIQRRRANDRKSSHVKDDDEVEEIARLLNSRRQPSSGVGSGKNSIQGEEDANVSEQVTVKGTGKAVEKVLQLALWFKQRQEKYIVCLRTGTACAIDDIEINHNEAVKRLAHQECSVQANNRELPKPTHLDAIHDNSERSGPEIGRSTPGEEQSESISSRLRYTSVLELAVSLR